MAFGKSQLTNPEVVRLELVPPTKEENAMLQSACEQLRQVANACVRYWLRYHDEHNSMQRLRDKQPVCPCPPDFLRDGRYKAIEVAPGLHSGTLLGTFNWLCQTITSQKSPRNNCKRWLRVLDYSESHWSFQYPLPIRLWNSNAKIVRSPEGVSVQLRVDRVKVEGKKSCESTPLRLAITKPKSGNRSAGHRLAYLAACEIADGKRKLAQSQLMRDERSGKWFLSLTVSGAAPEEHAERDATKTLFIRPGSIDALRMRANTISGGFGEDEIDRVAKERFHLDSRRKSWMDGHAGEKLPATVRENLSYNWRKQSSSICDRLVTEVVNAVRKRDFGRVVWLDGNNRKAALALAGKSGDGDDRELFPFELLRRKAKKRLQELGVEVLERANFRSVKRRISERKKRVAASRV